MKQPPAPLLFHSPTGHLEFHCQISLGPCVWAPESYKDHIALPLQSQLHTHTQRHSSLKRLALTEPSSSLRPTVCPISTYLVIQLPDQIDCAATTTLPSTSTDLPFFFPTLTTSLVVFCKDCCRSATTGGQMDASLTTF